MNLCVSVCSKAACARMELPLCPEHKVFYCSEPRSASPEMSCCPYEGCKAPRVPSVTCKDCGSAGTLHAIGFDLDEIAYVRSCYAEAPDVLKHTLLTCRDCHIGGFPCSRSAFTVRTDESPFVGPRGAMDAGAWVPVTIHYPNCSTTDLRQLPVTIPKATLHTLLKAHAPTLDAWMQGHPGSRMFEFMVPTKAARRKLKADAGRAAASKAIGLRLLSKTMSLSANGGIDGKWDAVLNHVVTALTQAPAGSLFPEWSVLPAPSTEELTLLTPTASAEAGDARRALPNVIGSWMGPMHTLNTWWQATLSRPGVGAAEVPIPVKLTKVDIAWECTADAKLIPRRCVLETSLDGVQWVVVAAPAAASAKQTLLLDTAIDAAFIRIWMKGYSDGNGSRRHGIASVRAYAAQSTEAVVPVQSTLQDVTTLLSISAAVSGAARTQSLVGMVSLARASASLHHVLELVSHLREVPVDSITPDILSLLTALIAAVEEAATEERKRQLAVERAADSGSIASPSASGDLVAIPAAFDADKSWLPSGSGTVELRESNMVAASSSGSHSVALLNRGFTSGKAAWEFRLEEDTSSQCTCFGAAIKPIRDCNYEKSRELWMYRAYNGYKYVQGTCNSSGGNKINKGDTVRCELDMGVGTLGLMINGVLAHTFTGLQGNEVFPAIQFYSSGRVVRFLKLEATSTAAAAAVSQTHLASLQEVESSVGYGSLGKAGDLGYTFGTNRKVTVNTSSLTQSLSMHPPSNHDGKSYAFARYAVNRLYERFSGSVALNDGVPSDKLRQHGSPVRFSVYGDGKLLWHSEAVSASGIVHAFDVSVLEVASLELRVQAENKSKYCHAVWVEPTFLDCGDWACAGWRNSRTSFVCEVTGSRRGETPAITYATPLSAVCPENVSEVLLERLGALAAEYSRGMKTPVPLLETGESSVELCSPYAIEVASASIATLLRLMEQELKLLHVNEGRSLETCASLLKVLRANLRRLVVSRILPTKVFADAVSTITNTGKLLESYIALPGAVSSAAAEIRSGCIDLFCPSMVSRVEYLRGSVRGAGVVELQFEFPMAPVTIDEEGNTTTLETIIMMMQLRLRDLGWRFQLLGRWPAKVYLVFEVPHTVGSVGAVDCVPSLFETELEAMFESVGITTFAFPDGIKSPFVPIKVEANCAFDRRERLLIEPPSVMRVYDAADGTAFESVLAHLHAFLPARSPVAW